MAATNKQHLYDQVASQLSTYVEEMSDMLAEGMTEGGRAPFAVKLTPAEQEAYYVEKYADMVYHPDGTENEEGRTQLVQMFGADGFAAIARAVIAARMQHAPVLGPLSYPQYGKPVDESPVHESPAVREVSY